MIQKIFKRASNSSSPCKRMTKRQKLASAIQYAVYPKGADLSHQSSQEFRVDLIKKDSQQDIWVIRWFDSYWDHEEKYWVEDIRGSGRNSLKESCLYTLDNAFNLATWLVEHETTVAYFDYMEYKNLVKDPIAFKTEFLKRDAMYEAQQDSVNL